jgi:hypothetical protein
LSPRHSWDSLVPPGGTYANVDYAYQVVLPTGVAADCADPPRPNHGFLAVSPLILRTSPTAPESTPPPRRAARDTSRLALSTSLARC